MYESGEDYLETILILKQRNGQVRSVDVATELGFTRPSISRAMSILKSDGYITMSAAGFIELTEAGKEKAEWVYERHCLIADFLVKCLGVSEKNALQDACRMEHIISQESFEQIKSALKHYGAEELDP